VDDTGVRIWKLCNPDPIRNFFMNSMSKPYPKSKNYRLRYPIRNHSLSCKLAYKFSRVLLPQEVKAVVILPFVRYDWLKWSCDKDDT